MPAPVLAQPRERDQDNEHAPRPEMQERGDRAERELVRKHERRKQRREMPVERIDEAIQTLFELHGNNPPKWIKAMEKLAEKKPEMVAKRLGNFPSIYNLMDVRKNNPQAFQTHAEHATQSRKIAETVGKLRRAVKAGDEDKADALRIEMRDAMEAVFAARLELKRLEIERQRERLEQAEQELVKLENNKEGLINKKLADLEKRGMRGANAEREDLRRTRPGSDAQRPREQADNRERKRDNEQDRD